MQAGLWRDRFGAGDLERGARRGSVSISRSPALVPWRPGWCAPFGGSLASLAMTLLTRTARVPWEWLSPVPWSSFSNTQQLESCRKGPSDSF